LHYHGFCEYLYENQFIKYLIRMTNSHRSLFLLIGIVIISSCVPASHFQEMRSAKISSEQERDSLLIENKQLEIKLTELEARLSILDKEIGVLLRDSTNRAIMLRNTKADLERARSQFNELQQTQESILKGSARETTRLLQQLQTTQVELISREDRLKEMEDDLNAKERVLQEMTEDLEKRNARLVELEGILSRQDSIVNALHNTISAALRGFEGQGLSVYERNGKVYVSLEEQLLFQTGSTVVDPNGVRALKDLAQVLENNTDINIMIEGHTDDVPVTPGPRMQDNWDLSVLRATSIVRILLEGTSINPQRFIVAGRGEHMAVAAGQSPEARRKNRRTEIILTPRLDELFRILESN
jgi:chemotaxis protein MotB